MDANAPTRQKVTSRTRHILFIDESGGHDLKFVDPNYPVFVLVGLLVGEAYYAKTLVPRVKALKAANGFARSVVLHSSSIRRHEEPFQSLNDAARRVQFYEALNCVFQTGRFRIYGVVIDKMRLSQRFLVSPNPYDISLSQLLSLTCGAPETPTINRPSISRIVAESRGRREDKQLQAEYQRFRRHGLWSYGAKGVQSRRPRTVGRVFPSRIDFVRKSRVVCGLELADLAAYPIGRAYVRGETENPAYQAVASRIRALVPFP